MLTLNRNEYKSIDFCLEYNLFICINSNPFQIKNYDTYLSSPINSINRKIFTSKKINFRFHLPNYFYLRFSGRKYKSVSGCKVIPSISSRTAKV